MKAGENVVFGGGSAGVWPEMIGFAGSLALAWRFDWRTTDLVWGLWFSSLVGGRLVIGLGTSAPLGFAPGLAGPVRWWLAAARGLYYGTILVLPHMMLLTPLRIMLPVEELRGSVLSGKFWLKVGGDYWPILVGGLLAARDELLRAPRGFVVVAPFLQLIRTLVVVLILTPVEIFGGTGKWISADQFWCYAVVAAVYFSPWRF